MRQAVFVLALLSAPAAVFSQAVGESDEQAGTRDARDPTPAATRTRAFTLQFHGNARARYEYDDGFTLKAYQPGDHDQLLLDRVRLDLTFRVRDRARFFLQLQDAHAFLTRFDDADFPKSNPVEDTLDVRQLYLEWPRIGGSAVGFRIGRQQISYGDQRVFGPGN